MKSQDILILLKLVALHKQEFRRRSNQANSLAIENELGFADQAPGSWLGWETEPEFDGFPQENKCGESYSLKSLEAMTGVSKTEIGASLRRSLNSGLAVTDRKSQTPKANINALKEFLVHGFKYVFPAKLGELARGIPTGFAAPVMTGHLMSSGEHIPIWRDPYGKAMGQVVEPIYKSVPAAVKKDPDLYQLLALLDAIRLGNAREQTLAVSLIEKLLTL